MALALDLNYMPVSTLAALAWPARHAQGSVLAAIDARMGEVYCGWFRAEGEGLLALAPEWMAAPGAIDVDASALVGVGSGFAAAEGALAQALLAKLAACDPTALPRASDVARIAAMDFAAGRAIAPDLLEPAYLRDKVALTLAEQRKK
jgi:tRNA threonylcarbamoyladenosine biosynthesis protein TsaB